MSKEHAWPQWLGDGVEVEPTQTTRKLGFGRTAPHAYSEAPTIVTTKPGSALTTRIREVCVPCNEGWMSQLEQDVKPLLRRLWATSYPLGVTTFTADETALVARWAVKTAWVRERAQPGPVTPTPAMRAAFTDNVMRDHAAVWVARHAGRSNFGVYVTQIEALHQDHPDDTKLGRHVLICTLTFRGLSILVRTDDDWGVPQFELPSDCWTRIWPAPSPIVWPPARAASDDDVFLAAAHFSSWMRMPDLLHFHRDPSGIQHRRRN